MYSTTLSEEQRELHRRRAASTAIEGSPISAIGIPAESSSHIAHLLRLGVYTNA
jgi:hypothetical protein